MNTDFSFNLVRVLALMPINEDKMSPEKWHTQRRGNITILCATLAFMAISVLGRLREIPTHSLFPAHTPQRIIDNLAIGELFFLEPLVFMWVISLGLMLLQRWDLFRQPTLRATKRSRGRPKGNQVQEGIGLTNKGLAGLVAFFNGSSNPLSSPQVRSLIKALSNNEIQRMYLTEEYTDSALADWLIKRFRANIRKTVKSSATIKSADINDEYVNKYVQRLKDIYAQL